MTEAATPVGNEGQTMCPACLTSMALWAAGTTSAGGLGWAVIRRLRPHGAAATINTERKEPRDECNNCKPPSRIAR